MNDIALSPVETASADEVRAMQDRKLRRQMAYLKTHSPFAAEKLASAGASFEDIRTVDDLAGLPFTTKQDLRDSQRLDPPFGGHAAATRERIVRVHASSGTTGVPSYIPVTAHDSALWREAIRRVFRCQGVRRTSTVAMGFSIGFFVGGIPLAQGIEDLGATFLPIGAGATDRLLDSIALMGADVLACTPSYALYLAEAARERGIDVAALPVKRLTVGAEPGGGVPGIRRHIEEAWRATVTESVGNGDVVPVYAAESDVRDGCHFLTPDMVIMEIIDPDTGEVLPPDRDGVEGEMAFTHIDREAAPLLRFRSGDRVTVRNSPCAQRAHRPAHPGGRAHRRPADPARRERLAVGDPGRRRRISPRHHRGAQDRAAQARPGGGHAAPYRGRARRGGPRPVWARQDAGDRAPREAHLHRPRRAGPARHDPEIDDEDAAGRGAGGGVRGGVPVLRCVCAVHELYFVSWTIKSNSR